MERYLYLTLIVLFILSACQPCQNGQGYATIETRTTIPTATLIPAPTPTETPEPIKLIQTISEKAVLFEKLEGYSRITWEDFTSGRLLELERKWLEENPFPENAVPITGLSFKEFASGVTGKYSIDTNNIMFRFNTDYTDPLTRPLKIISYYVLWDENFFKEFGITESVLKKNNYVDIDKEYSSLGIVSWAWLNPDRSTTIGHTLLTLNSNGLLQGDVLMPLVDSQNLEKINMDNNVTLKDSLILIQIYQRYPELSPLELSKDWVETKNMPKGLETKIFGHAAIGKKWSQESQ